jgi:hypothetical protein
MIKRAVLAIVLALGLFSATQTAQSFEFIGTIWPDWAMPVPYCVNPNDIPPGTYGEPVMSAEYFRDQIQYAFQQWQDTSGGWISFAYQGFCDTSPWDDSDGVNTVGWGSLPYDAVGATIPHGSHSHYLRDGAFGEMYEADIIIDTRLAQSFEDPAYFNEVLFPHIILHEAGHLAGLDHSSVECSVMSPVGLRFGMCQDDIDAIRTLYPPH